MKKMVEELNVSVGICPTTVCVRARFFSDKLLQLLNCNG